MKITTDFVGNENGATIRTRLQTILDFYRGPGTYAALVASAGSNFWGQLRAEFNAILPPGQAITSGEVLGDTVTPGFLSDLNRVNDLKVTLPHFMPSLRLWYDLGDLAGLWQDTVRTVAATAVGQTVAGYTDWSGRNNHGHQPTAPSRPPLANGPNGLYVDLDGVADCFETVNAVDLGGSNKVTVSAAVRTGTGADGSRCIVEAGINTTGSFQLYAPRATGAPNGAVFGSRGSGASYIQSGTDTGYAPPRSMAMTGQGDIAAPISRLRIDGTVINTLTTSQGTGNYGNHKLFFGSRGGSSFFFFGGMGNIMVLNDLASTNELRILLAIMNRRLP